MSAAPAPKAIAKPAPKPQQTAVPPPPQMTKTGKPTGAFDAKESDSDLVQKKIEMGSKKKSMPAKK